jgi:GMP reductase
MFADHDKFDGGKRNYRGSVSRTLDDIMGGLRSACTYVGTESLKDFSKCCKFIRVNRTHNRIFD